MKNDGSDSRTDHAPRVLSLQEPNCPPPDIIFGDSVAMLPVRRRIERFAETSLPVLIIGESGVGKDVLAHFIHQKRPGRAGAFVKLNCATAPSRFFSAELLRIVSSAPIGASPASTGSPQVSYGATVFLDDVFELDSNLQSTLQELMRHEKSQPGRDCEGEVPFRLICATSKDPDIEIARGRFRPDLYSEISLVTINVPPLRDRRSDIPRLVEYFLKRFCSEYDRSAPPLNKHVMEAVTRREWSGNIRELENVVRRYVILGADQTFSGGMEPCSGIDPTDEGLSLKARTRQAVHEIERELILDVLRANNWNRKDAARKLHISYRALMYKLKAAGLPPKRRRQQHSSETTGVSDDSDGRRN